MLTIEQKDKIIELRKKGYSDSKIREKTGFSIYPDIFNDSLFLTVYISPSSEITSTFPPVAEISTF